MDSNGIFIKCECGTEGMVVNNDPEYDQYYFSYWGYGTNPKNHGLWRRIKYVIGVIFGGKIWNDAIILDRNGIEKLEKFIKETENVV